MSRANKFKRWNPFQAPLPEVLPATEGDLERARALASQAQEICRTPAGRDLEMVSSWLAGAGRSEPRA